MTPADSPDNPAFAAYAPRHRRAAPTVWTVIVVLLSLGAIGLEWFARICATTIFDPIPNPGYLVAYLTAALAPLLANRVLRGGDGGPLLRRLPRGRVLALAMTLSLLSFLVALTACFMLGPILIIGVVGVLVGLGLVVLAPVFLAVLSALQLRALRSLWKSGGYDRRTPRVRVALPALLLSAAALGWVVVRPLAVGGLMATATDPTRPDGGSAAVTWLRRLGGQEAVLARCYGARLPYFEALGYQVGARDGAVYRGMNDWPGWDGRWWSDDGSKRAKRLYFLITGRSFTSAPAPWTVRHQRPGNWSRDVAAEETGGTRVGRMVPGLSLDSSKVEGVLDPGTATTEYDWTLVFKNAGFEPAEARADVVLPPGGVVHKVSLWINGEERPAAFGATAQVRKAYESVAVVRRRDPLLVTMPAPGRLLAQCFPVLPGQTMQIRLGITAPLAPQEENFGRMTFTPPAFGQVNFEQPLTLKHEFTLRAPYPAGGTWPASQGWKVEDVNGRKTVRASFGRNVIFAPPRLMVATSPLHLLFVGTAPPPPPVRDLTLVLDTGAAIEGVFSEREQAALAEALANLPPAQYPGGTRPQEGWRVRLVDARFPGRAVGPLDPVADAARVREWLRGRRYVGGVDAVPALSAAIRDAARGGTVVFLHGPVPDAVSDPTPLVEPLKGQRRDVTFLGLQAVAQAPNAIDDRLATLPNVRSEMVATYGGDLAEAVATVLPGGKGELHRRRHPYVSDGDPRWRRIDTARAARDAWYAHGNFGPEAWKASKAAADARLVTPLSGAVVLETREQYEEHGLDDGTKKKKSAAKDGKAKKLPEVAEASDDSTAVPEPGTLVLMGGAGAAALAVAGLRRRRRRGSVRPAGTR